MLISTSILLDIHVPCKMLGILRTATTLMCLCSLTELFYRTRVLIRCYVQILTLQKPHIPASFNVYLIISKCVTAVILWNFSRHYLRNRSTSGISALGYIGVLQLREYFTDVWHTPPGTPCTI